jgi:AcrR family transcriptional regulator
VCPVAISTQEQIVLVAERLFAERGVDGVSLRQIGAAAGSGNNSAVQYHFGSKDQLVQAIFEYRLPRLHERRMQLIDRLRPASVRGWVECHALPIVELADESDSHYVSFVAMLEHRGRIDVFENLPDELLASARAIYDAIAEHLVEIPEPLRTQRISHALIYAVQAASDREQAKSIGRPTLPFMVFTNDLIDGLAGFLEAPVSAATDSALRSADPAALRRPLHL